MQTPTAEAAAHMIDAHSLMSVSTAKITADKESFRKMLRWLRRSLPQDERAAAAEAVADLFPPPAADAVVALYWPAPGELDPRPLARRLAAAGVTLALPTTPADAQTLLFRRWDLAAPLIAGRFASEPSPDQPAVDPTVVIAPLLGFDLNFNRLGQGGGWYDRSLAALSAQGRRPRFIGLAFAAQEVAALPIVPGEDQPLDAVLTERAYRARG